MAKMAQLAAELASIDADILRLHKHSVDPDTEELSALLDLSQIDDLLERRYRLSQPPVVTAKSRSRPSRSRPSPPSK